MDPTHPELPAKKIKHPAQKIGFHYLNIMRLDLKGKISYFTEKSRLAL